LLTNAVVVNQNASCRIISVSPQKATQFQRDVFFFGCILIQLALHSTIDLGGMQVAKNDTVPEESYKNLKQLFLSEMENQEGDSPLADSLEFADALSAEVKLLSGITQPKASENIPKDAIESMENLCVQCCSVISGNRPEMDGVEDWILAIVEQTGAPDLTEADKHERERMLWALQTNDREIFDDLEYADESEVFLGKKVEKKSSEDGGGYESDDSFQPPPVEPTKPERRASRLSMFLDVEAPVTSPVNSRPSSSQVETESAEELAKRKKKMMSVRMSIKPQAMERFAQANKKADNGPILTPRECRTKFDKQDRLIRFFGEEWQFLA
jgi:hypothetical protein